MSCRAPAQLAEALYRNAQNAALAWRLFKLFLSSPSPSPAPSLRSFAISRILVQARMVPEIRELHHHLLLFQPPKTACFTITALTLASPRCGLFDEGLSLCFDPSAPTSPLLLRQFDCTIPSWSRRSRPTVWIRDDGSRIAMKVLKQVRRAWGQGSIQRLEPQDNHFDEDWLDAI